MLLKLVSFICATGIFAFNPLMAQETQLKDIAAKMVPDSKLILQDGHEFKFQTTKSTIVEVELNKDGSIDEASGESATNGDIFNPGGELMNLAEAVSALQKAEKSPTGDWSFEKSTLNGWIYEFEGLEKGKEIEYFVDAKNGKLIKSRIEKK